MEAENKIEAEDLSSLNAPDEVETEATPVAAAPPEKKPVEKPTSFKHPADLRLRALSLGGEPAWVDSVPTHELQAAIVAYENDRRRQQYTQAPPPKKDEDEEIDLGIADDELDPVAIKALKKVASTISKKIKSEYEEKLTQAEKRNQERERAAFTAKVDEIYDEMPAELQKYVGSDAKGCDAFRNAIWAEAKKQFGDRTPSAKKMASVLTQTAKDMFGIVEEEEVTPAPATHKVNGKANGKPTKEDYASGQLGKATNAKPKSRGQQEADKEFQEMFANAAERFGRTPSKSEFDDLPE